MPVRLICPICGKRRAERFCPAKGEKICAVCCGVEREVTLDCPHDCAYLISAHRYEQEHRKPLNDDEVQFPTVDFSPNVVYEKQSLLAGFGQTILKFAASRRDLTDRDTLAAIVALAETYRTLIAGIYYEKAPDFPIAHALYTALAGFIADYKKQAAEHGDLSRAGFPNVKDSEVFYLLVYLARMCRSWTNGRPRSRIFLEFLRTQLRQDPEVPAEASRIVLP